MSQKTKIEWADATWSPIRASIRPDALNIAKRNGYASLVQILQARKPNGDLRSPTGKLGHHCERVSPGCNHCYSETNNHRCLPHNGTGLPFDRRSRDLIDTVIDEKILLQPLRWRAPLVIFVESQSDLFGEWVTDEMIDRVFAVMALCQQHRFLVLTKREKRLEEYFCGNGRSRGEHVYNRAYSLSAAHGGATGSKWPLPHVGLGVSAENQKYADLRIPHLLRTPAAMRYLSHEPALGALDVKDYLACLYCRSMGSAFCDHSDSCQGTRLDWVIDGGESGHNARPAHPDWFRSLRDQCQDADTPYFHKQNGEWTPADFLDDATADHGDIGIFQGSVCRIESSRGRNARAAGWCRAIPVPEREHRFGDGTVVVRVGKKAAGRLLDGREWNEVPEEFMSAGVTGCRPGGEA